MGFGLDMVLVFSRCTKVVQFAALQIPVAERTRRESDFSYQNNIYFEKRCPRKLKEHKLCAKEIKEFVELRQCSLKQLQTADVNKGLFNCSKYYLKA